MSEISTSSTSAGDQKPTWLWTLAIISWTLNVLFIVGFILFPLVQRPAGVRGCAPQGGAPGLAAPGAGPESGLQHHRGMRNESGGSEGDGQFAPGGAQGQMGGNRERFGGERPPMGGASLERFVEPLNLTDAQKKQIQPILEQQSAAIQKKSEENHKAIQQLIEDTRAKIKPLLNADQQKQLESFQTGPKGGPGSQNGDAPRK